jgi:hypothetical protein
VGAIIAPFIIGLIADRYFNAEKILGLHIAGALLMYQMYHSEEVGMFLHLCFRLYDFIHADIGTSKFSSFKQMKDPEKNFQILEFGNYWMDISRTIYQLYFHWDSRRSYSRTIKNTFLYQELPH